MELLFDVIFAWASVALVILLSVIWILRIGLKKGWFGSKSWLGKMNRSLRIHHKNIGIAFCITSFIHGFYSSVKILSLNYGTACFVVGLLLGGMYMVKKHMERKKWLIIHRVLTICLLVLLVIHIVNVGGAPATSVLLSNIGRNNEIVEEIAPQEEQKELEATQEAREKVMPQEEEETPKVTEEEPQVAEETPQTEKGAVYKDGVYTGVATAFGPNLTVEVTIVSGEITDVVIVSHNEKNAMFYDPAFEAVPDDIVNNQSVEVDSVSGSTYTSVGVKNAVLDALAQALISGELPQEEALPTGKGHH
jgi:uncharacterized protein with FMN-binding domain